MGAEEHAHRPGWGGSRHIGLDTPPIRLGGRRARLYCAWFVAKVRAQDAEKLRQMQQFWLEAAWRVAMGVRAGPTFGEVTQEIRADLPSLQERLAMPSEKKQKPKKTPSPGGNPRKWARTDEAKKPKTTGATGPGNRAAGTRARAQAGKQQWS